MKNKGLGRGLDAILVDNSDSSSGNGISVVRLSEVEPNATQPRKYFDDAELSALSDSISQYGVIQPISVRPWNDRYQIVTGERRWRAARMAGLLEIPVIIISADDKKAAELALIENIQRSNLNPIEEALGFASLIEEYGLSQEEVATRIGKSRSGVTNALRLLTLPKEVQDLLTTGALSVGHAKVLLGLSEPEKISATAKQIVARNLSVRETENLVNIIATPVPQKPALTHDVDHTRELELRIQKHLGRTVKLAEKGKSHTITIGYSDNRDLDKLLVLLCGDSFVDSL